MKPAAWCGVAAALLALLFFHPELFPPCPIWLAFHLRCPGCGATRALAALLHGHLDTAWRENPLFLVALPIATICVAVERLRGHLPCRREIGLAGAVLAAGYMVLRNI